MLGLVADGVIAGKDTRPGSTHGWRTLTLTNNYMLCIICHLAPTNPPASEIEVCLTFLHFLVAHSMAPLGRLLVYYVRENGEGVTDSLQFTVKSSFENQVSATLPVERRGWPLLLLFIVLSSECHVR